MLEKNRPADALTVKHIDRCLSCLACMTTCPSDVNYMHLVDGDEEPYRKDFSKAARGSSVPGASWRCFFTLNRFRLALAVAPLARSFYKPTEFVEPFVLSITASLRRAGKGVRLVIGNGAAKAIDDGLASLIARAIATRNMFLAGRDDSIDAMASRLGVRRDYVAVLVRLSYLSPEIIGAILAGQQPVELTPTRLVMLSRNLPHDWQEQRRLLGFAPA